jgi:hypothetical protein
MKTYQQCLDEQRLTARAKSLLDRIERIDDAFDAALASAKEHELGAVQLILDLLLSGPSLTVYGWRYIERQLTQRESWVADDVTTDNG